MVMRIAVAGGGPGGLFFATLIRRADPTAEVTVFERNRADTFGFGVGFSDRTLDGMHRADARQLVFALRLTAEQLEPDRTSPSAGSMRRAALGAGPALALGHGLYAGDRDRMALRDEVVRQ